MNRSEQLASGTIQTWSGKFNLSGFRHIERQVGTAIAEHFGLTSAGVDLIKSIDEAMLYREKIDLMKNAFDWEFPDDLHRIEEPVEGWSPETSEMKFNQRWFELAKRRTRNSP